MGVNLYIPSLYLAGDNRGYLRTAGTGAHLVDWSRQPLVEGPKVWALGESLPLPTLRLPAASVQALRDWCWWQCTGLDTTPRNQWNRATMCELRDFLQLAMDQHDCVLVSY